LLKEIELDKSVFKTDIEIRNANGLHMRPAMQFVDLASQFDSEIKVSDGRTEVDGKSIMQMTMLAATVGTKLVIIAEGSDGADAIEALKELVEDRLFDEGQPRKVSEASD